MLSETISSKRLQRKGPRSRAPMAAVEIREMKLEDVPAVFELGQRLFTAERWPTLYRSWDDNELVHLFSTDKETCLVAEVEGRVVGFVLGQMMEKPRCAWRYGWLLWLGVEPLLKRRRIGKRLVAKLTDLFVAREARIMLVDTDEANLDALAFFRKNGFGQEIRHVYLSKNLDEYIRKNGNYS